MRLGNKVAIVTGSARGLGKAIALRFAREGARITLCDLLDCTPVAEEIQGNGGEALALTANITRENDMIDVAARTVERFGQIDILVNNAGAVGGIEIPEFIKPPDRLTPEDWDLMLGVNVKGTYLSCKAAIAHMKTQEKGTIVNIASTVGLYGAPAFLHYSTSKGGIITMTYGLATHLGAFNINVNAVAPGAIMTEAMQAVVSEESEKHIIDKQMLKKRVGPEDIAAAALFLASDEAAMITGQVIGVNGGEYLH